MFTPPTKSVQQRKAERMARQDLFDEAKASHEWNSIVSNHTAINGGKGMSRMITNCKLCGQDYVMLKVYPVICPNSKST